MNDPTKRRSANDPSWGPHVTLLSVTILSEQRD